MFLVNFYLIPEFTFKICKNLLLYLLVEILEPYSLIKMLFCILVTVITFYKNNVILIL